MHVAIKNLIDGKLESLTTMVQRQGNSLALDQQSQQQATKLLNFLSGALQLMPIGLCSEIAPKVLRFAEIEDSSVKVQAYLTLEVLFASRRFEDGQVLSCRILKSLLDNCEIITNVTYEGEGDGEEGEE